MAWSAGGIVEKAIPNPGADTITRDSEGGAEEVEEATGIVNGRFRRW